MATITSTTVNDTGEALLTSTTLDGTDDTFTYLSSKTQLLIISNDSGAGITPTIVGDEATEVTVSGLGLVDVSGGYTFDEIADGTSVVIRVGVIKNYLTGTISITNGTGLTAELLEM